MLLIHSHYFNPIHPCTLACDKLTALTAKCSTGRSHIQRSRQALSICGGTESTYITIVVYVGPFGSVGRVARVPSVARL